MRLMAEPLLGNAKDSDKHVLGFTKGVVGIYSATAMRNAKGRPNLGFTMVVALGTSQTFRSGTGQISIGFDYPYGPLPLQTLGRHGDLGNFCSGLGNSPMGFTSPMAFAAANLFLLCTLRKLLCSCMPCSVTRGVVTHIT